MFFSDEIGINMTFFSFWHVLQILITALVIYLIIRYKDQIRDYKHEKVMRYVFAFVLLTLEISLYIWKGHNGTLEWVNFLPLGVCKLNIWISIYLIISKNEKVFYLIYFWGLGAILSIFFPDISYGPDRYRYYQFFYSHIIFLWVYMYLIFVQGYRPTIKHFKISALLLLIVAVAIALPVSLLLDHNFMFMLHSGGTPLEILEPLGHVIYVIGTVVSIFLVMVIYYSPIYFFVIRKEKKKVI